MKTTPIVQHALQHAGENLYRNQSSGIYYALFKRDGKQIRRSLKTTDKELARRKLSSLREQVQRLTADDAKTLRFAEYKVDEKTGEPTDELIGGLAKRWFDVATAGLKPSSRERRLVAIKSLSPAFQALTVRSITLRHVENWYSKRSQERAAQTVNIEVETLRGILAYACKHGLLLDNPAMGLKRLRLTSKAMVCPTREQFKGILESMRCNKGKRDAAESADMVEFLGYSGWRVGEARNLHWQHVNFELGQITIVGDEQTGTKNRKAKTVPMSVPLVRLLQCLLDHSEQPVEPTGRVFAIENPRKAIATACKALGYPSFTVHALRHFFITNAIEAGLDFRAVAGLVNHSDGGALLARRYAHLRDTHLTASVKKLTFDANGEEPKNVVAIRLARSGCASTPGCCGLRARGSTRSIMRSSWIG
jgi:integrase